MFIATALLYPCALAVLCLGAALALDRVGGRWLPASLMLSVGAALQIALSQLSTLVPGLAPATPWLMGALALIGLLLGRRRLGELRRSVRARPLLAAMIPLAYVLALAPVLLSGRTTFSSFMALADSAVHLIGADYLIRHGQSYAHLDLRNSYGSFINAYYNTSYPSGADTLFGGSAALLGLPLIWAFQPFNAFILATAVGPAWRIARRLRLSGAWAAAAALTATLPALVYGYELLGSIKELTALSMLLSSGAILVSHRRWMRAGPGALLVLAVTLAAGISALGVAFGVWALGAVLVLAVLLVGAIRAGAVSVGSVCRMVAVAAPAGLLASLPTWRQLSGALQVANDIAGTNNPGNLHTPLRAIQIFGIWIVGSYKLLPFGRDLTLTHLLVALVALAALLGVAQLVRTRALVLAGWFALTLLAWLVVTESVTTWASAKTLMITSPVVMLLAWGGVAALRALPGRALALGAAVPVALMIGGGVLVSDAMQYRSANLAPTQRYQELASLDARFAGRGPALFTDFDEYAMYELRDLDIGGPDFVYPPRALAAAAGGYGNPVDLDRLPPRALLVYPLIITRRDPGEVRPPAAYRLAWRGHYYEVWERRPGAPAALVHRVLSGDPAEQCNQIAGLAAAAGAPPGASADGGTAVGVGVGGSQAQAPRQPAAGLRRALAAAPAPEVLQVALGRSRHPRHWGHYRTGLVMNRPGSLNASLRVPSAGLWRVWLQGELMPTVRLRIDGRALADVGGQLSGNSVVPDTVPPIAVRLTAGEHTITLTRFAAGLAPGGEGSAVIDAILLTPARESSPRPLRRVSLAHWRGLCGERYQWVELLPGAA